MERRLECRPAFGISAANRIAIKREIVSVWSQLSLKRLVIVLSYSIRLTTAIKVITQFVSSNNDFINYESHSLSNQLIFSFNFQNYFINFFDFKPNFIYFLYKFYMKFNTKNTSIND